MTIRAKALGLTAVAVAATLVLAGCSSTGGAQAESTAPATGTGGGGGAVADTPNYTVAMITHETPGDTFWDKIRSGAQAAATKDNITLKYSNDPSAVGQATLIQNAVDSKVDGIASTLVTPDALAAAVKTATDAGIPVVGFNSGIDAWKELGALTYFGSDENLAGNAVGERIAEAGSKHPLCVIQAEGSVALEARCAGVLAKAPGTENLQVNGADIAAVTSTIQAKLQQDPSIDYIVTLGAPIALAAVQAANDGGSKAKVVTFDLNADVAADIKAGTIGFSVDQQPYLQGYEAVDQLWLYLTNGNVLGGGLPVLTGPSFVDETNIDLVIKGAEAGTR